VKTSSSSVSFTVGKEGTERVVKCLLEAFPKEAYRINPLLEAPLGIELEASERKPTRSRPQENYYRKWQREFAEWCGLTPDEMHHEMLCKAFGSETFETKFGEKRRPLKRSARTTIAEYSTLIETLIWTAAELGFAIPPPPTPEQYEEYANG
jgi:hypothetical protein